MKGLYKYYWVLRYEPDRLWAWWHRKGINGKKRSLKEALATILHEVILKGKVVQGNEPKNKAVLSLKGDEQLGSPEPSN